ncbi:MAG: hypothetical protein RIR10_585, partial [Planctomycetota bacterium]
MNRPPTSVLVACVAAFRAIRTALARSRTLCASRSVLALIVMSFAGVSLVGCAKPLARPIVLTAPYDTERVWAIVPFANESGVSQVDVMAVADKFVSEVEGVEGLRCLPLNRTLAAMKSLGMTNVR